MKQSKKKGAPKKENPETGKISFRINIEMKETLTRMAGKEGRSLSNYVKRLISNAVNA